jgi:anti-sigma factor RsiW
MHPAAVEIDGALPDSRDSLRIESGGSGIVFWTDRGYGFWVVVETHTPQRVRQSRETRK